MPRKTPKAAELQEMIEDMQMMALRIVDEDGERCERDEQFLAMFPVVNHTIERINHGRRRAIAWLDHDEENPYLIQWEQALDKRAQELGLDDDHDPRAA